jgi:2-keto-4-pentenoate hydratase/2-oxohepta-3-ene-1,7-dioic acid hydratase in catechol pathway
MRKSNHHYVRFRQSPDEVGRWGLIDGRQVRGLDRAPWLPGTEVTSFDTTIGEVELLAPAEPTKIIALGYNFRELFSDPAAMARADEPHFSDEGFEPLIFLKAPNTISGPGEPIRLPASVSEAWIEVEIAAVIRRRAKNLTCIDDAIDTVFGITVGNDVTALNVLGRDWHLARSKSLDGFCPLGPVLVEGWDADPLDMSAHVNGQLVQHARSDDRVLGTLEAVQFVSQLLTLEPGDVVLTGTPRGARQAVIDAGDEIELRIEGLGTLRNPVTREYSSADALAGRQHASLPAAS